MCKAFKTNQSKSLHLKKAGRKLFPPKADGPEVGRSIGKARVFCILFGPPSEENKYESRKPTINWKEGFCASDFTFSVDPIIPFHAEILIGHYFSWIHNFLSFLNSDH